MADRRADHAGALDVSWKKRSTNIAMMPMPLRTPTTRVSAVVKMLAVGVLSGPYPMTAKVKAATMPA